MAKEEIKQTENDHDLEDKSSEVKIDKKEEENNETLTEEKIRIHCQEIMARFMVPKIITFLKDIPRTPTGKIEKGKLAKIPISN